FFGDGERITVVVVGLLRGIAAGGDLAEEPGRPPLVGTLTALSGKRQGSSCGCDGVLEAAREDGCLTQAHREGRLVAAEPHCLADPLRVLQQRDPFSSPSGERVGIAQTPRGHY